MNSTFFRKLAYDINAEPEELECARDMLMMFLYLLIVVIAILYMCARGL